jgi:hypothetical protein
MPLRHDSLIDVQSPVGTQQVLLSVAGLRSSRRNSGNTVGRWDKFTCTGVTECPGRIGVTGDSSPDLSECPSSILQEE